MSPGVFLMNPDGVFRRTGRPPYLTGADDGFVVGTTKPSSAGGAGPVPGSSFTNWTGGEYVDGNTGSQPYRLLESVRFTHPVKIRGKVHIRNFEATNWDNVQPTAETALINTQDASVQDVFLERGFMDPGEAGAHWYLNAISGHHTWAHRIRAQRVVDFFGSFNPHVPQTANVVTGCYVAWLAYWYSATAGVVHPTDNRTHNDGIQHQGGGGDTAIGRPYGLDVDGIEFNGRVFWPDGATVPTDQGNPAWEHLAHQGILTQHNLHFSTPLSPRIRRSWLRGFQHPLVFKTRGNDAGAPYDVVLQGVRLEDDARRYYGVSDDLHGVPGGRPFTCRIDRAVTVNGVEYPYPAPDVATASSPGAATSIEYALDGDNLYGTTTAVTAAARRGQPISVRRDNFTGT